MAFKKYDPSQQQKTSVTSTSSAAVPLGLNPVPSPLVTQAQQTLINNKIWPVVDPATKTFVATGSYGCVVKPAVPCAKSEKFPLTNEQDYVTYVMKKGLVDIVYLNEFLISKYIRLTVPNFQNYMEPLIDKPCLSLEPTTTTTTNNKTSNALPKCWSDTTNTGDDYLIAYSQYGGITLFDIVDDLNAKKLLIQNLHTIVLSALTALAELHKYGFVHLDCSLTNMVAREGQNLKLMDFGLSFYDPFMSRSDTLKSRRFLSGIPIGFLELNMLHAISLHSGNWGSFGPPELILSDDKRFEPELQNTVRNEKKLLVSDSNSGNVGGVGGVGSIVDEPPEKKITLVQYIDKQYASGALSSNYVWFLYRDRKIPQSQKSVLDISGTKINYYINNHNKSLFDLGVRTLSHDEKFFNDRAYRFARLKKIDSYIFSSTLLHILKFHGLFNIGNAVCYLLCQMSNFNWANRLDADQALVELTKIYDLYDKQYNI